MSENSRFTYAAIISITLPEINDMVTANVILTPLDSVESGGKVKSLGDCTLSDLQSYAQKLESEIWETYQSIRLMDLAAEKSGQVELTIQDKDGRTIYLQNWQDRAVLLEADEALIPEDEKDIETTSSSEESIVDHTISSEAIEDNTDTVELEGPPTEAVVESEEPAEELVETKPDIELIAEEVVTRVTVSDSEPVYAEREAVDDPNAYPTPAIAPSKARVRIAGKRLPIGNATWAAVDILIDEPAFRAAQAHALSSPDREVAGVMLGPPPEKQPDGRYVVHVIDTIIAKYTVMQGASVTYTPESWRYMNDKLAERYPDETAVMVGWYHTHPGFGIFLSGMDQFIHQNFFTQIWHTAFVLDPLARKSGFFCWDRQQTRVSRYDFYWPAWASGSW